VSRKRLGSDAKDLTVTLSNFRSAKQLERRLFCDNKAEEFLVLYLHKYILLESIIVTE